MGLTRGAGPWGDIAAEVVRTFAAAPAEVGTALEEVDHLPGILSDVADPDLSGGGIVGHTPGIAEAEGVDFAAGVGDVQKGIVGGDAIGFSSFGVIDVDAEDGGGEVVDALAGVVDIGGGGTIAGGDVEITFRAEDDIAAVVAAGIPFKDQFFGFGVEGAFAVGQSGLIGGEAVFARASGGAVGEDEDEAVVNITRMKGEAVPGAGWEPLPQVGPEAGGGFVGV